MCARLASCSLPCQLLGRAALSGAGNQSALTGLLPCTRSTPEPECMLWTAGHQLAQAGSPPKRRQILFSAGWLGQAPSHCSVSEASWKAGDALGYDP